MRATSVDLELCGRTCLVGGAGCVTGVRAADLSDLPDGPEGDFHADNLAALFAAGADAQQEEALSGTSPDRHTGQTAERPAQLVGDFLTG